MASSPKFKLPKTASKGEVITIKTLIRHKMESGQRKDKKGKVIPREIIHKFTAEFNGQLVFQIDMFPAIAANPYLEFTAKVNESGTFNFKWFDDNGSVYTASSDIAVS